MISYDPYPGLVFHNEEHMPGVVDSVMEGTVRLRWVCNCDECGPAPRYTVWPTEEFKRRAWLSWDDVDIIRTLDEMLVDAAPLSGGFERLPRYQTLLEVNKNHPIWMVLVRGVPVDDVVHPALLCLLSETLPPGKRLPDDIHGDMGYATQVLHTLLGV